MRVSIKAWSVIFAYLTKAATSKRLYGLEKVGEMCEHRSDDDFIGKTGIESR